MKVSEIASAVARREGHKSQARIGDIREIISIISDLAYRDEAVIRTLIQLGIQRAKRKKK